MTTWRARESEKQVRCREQNESTARAATDGGKGSFRCECGDGGCTTWIPLTHAEYAGVRSYATHFAMAPNHENPESEQVLEEHKRYAVVETVTEDATKRARRSDPDQKRRERRWS